MYGFETANPGSAARGPRRSRTYGICALVLATVLAAGLLAAPGVHAAWEDPVAISDPADVAGDTPQLAMGPAGAAAVAWWGGGRVMLARHLANGAWSAPVVIGSSASPVAAVAGVDAGGTVTAAWSEADGSETVIATWLPAAPWPSLSVLGQFSGAAMAFAPVVVTELAVNASGAAVLAGTSGSDDVAVAYRPGAGGSFDFTVEPGSMASPARDPHVAIDAAGAAVLLYRQGDAIEASRRASALGPFGATEAVNAGFTDADTPADLSVALDPAGNTVAGFTLRGNGLVAVGSAWSPPGGGWTVQWPLSPNFISAQGPTHARDVRVLVDANGRAALVWQQLQPSEVSQWDIDVRLGSSTTGAWSALESAYRAGTLTSSGQNYPPGGALAADGTLVVASETNEYPFMGAVARVRAPDGAWGAVRTVAPLHTVQSRLSVGIDDRGHIAVASAPDDGPSRKVVLVSVFDPVAPVVSPITLAGTRLAGDPVALTVTASDAWSATSVHWDFGDGAVAGGAATTAHAYDAAGTYVATATVTDTPGNVTSVHASVVVAAKRAELTKAVFRATWNRSRVHGTLLVGGTAPRPGAYTLSVTRGKRRAITGTLLLSGGPFTRLLTLPARLAPGRYQVALSAPFPATQVIPAASRRATLAAPAAGVVDDVAVTRRGGTMRARFHFVALARSKLAVTWWITSKGRGTQLARQSKVPRFAVTATVRLRGRHGRVTVTLTRAGAVVAQRSVTVR